MINLKILILLFLLSGLLVSCSTAQNGSSSPVRTPVTTLEGERFISKEGGFSIVISRQPDQTRNLGTEAIQKKGIDVGKQYIWKSEKTLYTIMYSHPFDENGNPMTQTLEEMNSGSRKGMLRSQANLLSEKPIFLDKYPGTEFHYVSPEGAKYVGRNYLVGAVGYQVVGSFGDEKFAAEVLKTLDSLKLWNDKK